MQKVTVQYEGADGALIEKTHYFNLSETDFTDIISEKPDFFKPSRLKDLVTRSEAAVGEDKVAIQAEMASFVKDVIIRAHGTRVGQEFFHLPEETLMFTRGLGLNAVLQQVLTTDQTLAAFFLAVLPASVREGFSDGIKK